MMSECSRTFTHTECQIEPIFRILDMLQIPAFLCHQRDRLASGKTGEILDINDGTVPLVS